MIQVDLSCSFFKDVKMFSNLHCMFFIITLITHNNAKLSLLCIVTSYYKQTSLRLEVCVCVCVCVFVCVPSLSCDAAPYVTLVL